MIFFCICCCYGVIKFVYQLWHESFPCLTVVGRCIGGRLIVRILLVGVVFVSLV